MSTSTLANKHCKPCDGNLSPLSPADADVLSAQLSDWERKGDQIVKTFSFKNHYRTMAFVDAVAFISHQEDHHPDMLVRYNSCTVTYTTHAINGLSENDFICAARLDALIPA